LLETYQNSCGKLDLADLPDLADLGIAWWLMVAA
jgi:hypothetical protein